MKFEIILRMRFEGESLNKEARRINKAPNLAEFGIEASCRDSDLNMHDMSIPTHLRHRDAQFHME
jgi:hypothetical protein